MQKSLLKDFVFLCVLLCSGINIYARTAADILPPEVYEELKQNGTIEKSYFSNEDVKLNLVPDDDFARKAADYWNKENGNPVFTVEELYIKSKEDLGKGNPSEVTMDKASSTVRSVSKMQGMKYYSNTRRKTTVLYEEAYCVESPENKNVRVDDQTEGSAEGVVEYSYLKDSSFGKTYYTLEYHQSEDEIFAGFASFEPIYSGFIKAVEKDNVRIGFVYIDCGDDVVVYMITQVKYPAIKILENTIYESFSARLKAVYDWFIDQY